MEPRRRHRHTPRNLNQSPEVTWSSTQASSEQATQKPNAAKVGLKLEAVVIPVSDVDRAKQFYDNLGWRLDADFPFDNGFRVVQFTPHGSGCSVQFGTNMTLAAPGSPRAST